MDLDKMMEEAGYKNPEENKQEQTTEVNTEEQNKTENVHTSTETTTESKTEETVDTFNLESFNKAFGRDYKSIDEINSLFSLQDEHKQAKALLEERESALRERDKALAEKLNPLNYFADENEFKVNYILKSNKDLNRSVVRKLVDSNLDELKDEDVLILNEVLETEGAYDQATVARIVKKKYGLNVNREDLEDEEAIQDYQAQEFLMKKDASSARKKLKELLNVEIPQFEDPLKAKQKSEEERLATFNRNKDAWGGFSNKFVDEFKSFPIEYELDNKEKTQFDVQITDDFKNVLKQNLPEIAAKAGLDVNNPDHVKAIREQVEKDYFWVKKGNVLKAFREELLSNVTEEEMKKYYNPTQPKAEQAPKVVPTEEEAHNKKEMERLAQSLNIKR